MKRTLAAALVIVAATRTAWGDDPANLALVLPLHGHLATVGTAVRDGFLAAYYQDNRQGLPIPVLHIYDDGEGGIGAVQTALASGADAVVGPLTKEQVGTLATLGNPPVPLLSLNWADASATHLYQFALAPEQEMAALVRTMKDQHVQTVRVVQQQDAASTRTRQGFEAAWQAAGGSVVPAAVLDAGQKGGVVAGLRKLLSDPASARLDALFVATPALTTQLTPTMSYYHTPRLPFYSLASAYDAAAPAIVHQDQSGMRFCDQPWIVQGGWPEQAELYGDNRAPSNYDRLYAFGGDAYTAIKTLLHQPGQLDVAARSGHLTLSADGRIQRDPVCVEYTDGHPQLIAPAGDVAAPAAGT